MAVMKSLKDKHSFGLACLILVQLVASSVLAQPFYLDKVALEDKQVQINKNAIKKRLFKTSSEKIEKIAAYLTAIGLSPDKPNFKFQVSRLVNSSTQFLFCDVEDWACLERKSEVTPKSKMRQDISDDLGVPVHAGEQLEMEYFFTQGWYNNHSAKSENYIIPETTVAEIMAEKIKSEGQKNIWMAIYGIDDIEDTMASVYNSINDKVKNGVPTYAVMDVSDEQQPNGFPRDYNILKREDGRYLLGQKASIDYSYIGGDHYNSAFSAPGWAEMYLTDVVSLSKEKSKFELRKFLLNDLFIKPYAKTKIYDLQVGDLTWIALNKSLNNYKETLSRTAFQYANNLQLLRLLNSQATTNEQAKARIEFPFTGIMHNKFIVFEKNSGERSVWTGTTNISRTCMGDESNSNLAILIKNDAIASAFLAEFNEMFSGESISSSKPKSLLTGAFHDKKRPNTKRYFTFSDGTEVRIHFSPTDDGEHRVLLPLIHSARPGDILRISMFGGGGFELVRAMQMAVARGVDIRIVFDNLTGSSVSSWSKAKDANLLQANPYAEKTLGSVQVRKNDWKGLNHHKTATLTRRLSDGSYQPEVIVIGSQNWSQTGNDINDENMVTIRNKTKVLSIMSAFNAEFDERLWPSSSVIGQ